MKAMVKTGRMSTLSGLDRQQKQVEFGDGNVLQPMLDSAGAGRKQPRY